MPTTLTARPPAAVLDVGELGELVATLEGLRAAMDAEVESPHAGRLAPARHLRGCQDRGGHVPGIEACVWCAYTSDGAVGYAVHGTPGREPEIVRDGLADELLTDAQRRELGRVLARAQRRAAAWR